MSDEEREQEEQSPRRPRVIDKRISARAQGESKAAPAPPESGPSVDPSDSVPAASAPLRAPDPSATSPSPGKGPSPETAPGQTGTAATQAGPADPVGAERVWTPEQEAEAKKMAQEIAQTPSFEWVVNAAVTLANVAATKLELGAGEDAQLAIDALAGLINSVGPRLEQAESPLRQTLAQLQLAYAQRLTGPAAP